MSLERFDTWAVSRGLNYSLEYRHGAKVYRVVIESPADPDHVYAVTFRSLEALDQIPERYESGMEKKG